MPATLTEAGKPARRFRAASSVSVIRVDPTRPPAHQCAWHLSPKRLPYSPRRRAQREYEPRRFSGPRKPGADGQCRRGPRTAAEPICRGTERSRPEKQPAGSAGFRLTDPDHRGVETNDLDSTRRARDAGRHSRRPAREWRVYRHCHSAPRRRSSVPHYRGSSQRAFRRLGSPHARSRIGFALARPAPGLTDRSETNPSRIGRDEMWEGRVCVFESCWQRSPQ